MCAKVQVSLDFFGWKSGEFCQGYEGKSDRGKVMGTVYTYTEARQNLASLLDKAVREAEVRVKSKDGQTFVINQEQKTI